MQNASSVIHTCKTPSNSVGNAVYMNHSCVYNTNQCAHHVQHWKLVFSECITFNTQKRCAQAGALLRQRKHVSQVEGSCDALYSHTVSCIHLNRAACTHTCTHTHTHTHVHTHTHTHTHCTHAHTHTRAHKQTLYNTYTHTHTVHTHTHIHTRDFANKPLVGMF